MSVREWHEKLAEHFRDLHTSREQPNGHPIYVLEHGLSEGELAALSSDVRSAVHVVAPSNLYWLPWAVYATELGYEYSGEEYWQTFERRTPGWADLGDKYRYWLRDAFARFAKQYGGARPTGDWARHFSIICWPITHAILPQDLQQQLARLLYDLRFVLRVEHLEDPGKLGRLLHARAHTGSSRFASFAQDVPLVGQIASALLLKDAARTSHLISEAALTRIASDLERERLARTWLSAARRRADDVRLKGTARPPVHAPAGTGTLSKPGSSTTGEPAPEANYRRSQLGIDPRPVLHPAGGGAWKVELEIPELQHLLESPGWATILANSRCRVAGASPRPLARGRLLYGPQRVPLERWPRSDEILLSFEGAPASISAALTTTSLLPPGPVWLFKVGADGSAYHIQSRVTRPGSTYVLLSRTALFEAGMHLRPVQIQCSGIFGAQITMPRTGAPTVDGLLREFGISRALTVQVIPTGVPPLYWDGEGHVEWLATDTPVIAIDRQTDAASVDLVLAGSEPARISITAADPNPTFIELPQLALGTHSIAIDVQTDVLGCASGTIEITIRAPRPWTGELSEQHAVRVSCDPDEPTLEDLISGRLSVEVVGPAGLRIDSAATLWAYRRNRRLYHKALPPFHTPFDSGAWHRTFVRDFLDDRPVQEKLDNAWAIEVEFAFGALAQRRFIFVRDVNPLRFDVHSPRKGVPTISLLDDSGLESHARISLRPFSNPDTSRNLPGTGQSRIALPEEGGLLEASNGEHHIAAVIAPSGVKGLSALKIAPELQHYRRAPDGVNRLLGLAGVWGGATPQGSQMARLRQCDVLRAFHFRLVELFCGSRWASSECTFMNDLAQSPHVLAREMTSDPRHHEFRRTLEATATKIYSLSKEERAEALCRALPNGREFEDVSQPIAKLALELMSVPERVGQQDTGALTVLLKHPVLLRGARFWIAVSHRAAQDRDVMTLPLYSGWN